MKFSSYMLVYKDLEKKGKVELKTQIGRKWWRVVADNDVGGEYEDKALSDYFFVFFSVSYEEYAYI